MSAIGAMFAPHHQEVADELVRVCRPGGTIGMLNWTPEGMIGALFRAMGPFAPPPPPGAQSPPLWGGEDHVRELFGDRVDFRTLERDVLEVTAFEHPDDYGEHFKGRYGPTITARKNAVANGREAEFDDTLRQFCDQWNLGTEDRARFEQEYLLVVGTPRVSGHEHEGSPRRQGIPVEFIGMIATRASSETRPAEGPLVDVPFTREFARVHEAAGFDRVLIGYYSDAPDGFVVAADVLAHTEHLGVLLAHRPGFVAPTVAARKLATLDLFSRRARRPCT